MPYKERIFFQTKTIFLFSSYDYLILRFFLKYNLQLYSISHVSIDMPPNYFFDSHYSCCIRCPPFIPPPEKIGCIWYRNSQRKYTKANISLWENTFVLEKKTYSGLFLLDLSMRGIFKLKHPYNVTKTV